MSVLLAFSAGVAFVLGFGALVEGSRWYGALLLALAVGAAVLAVRVV